MARKSTTPTKLKHTKRRQRAAPPQDKAEKSTYLDAALIRQCIIIKTEMAAFHGGWDADPDGNNIHVQEIAYPHSRRAKQAIIAAGNMQAKTWAGVAAKAAAMKTILDDESGGLEVHSENFYRSFALDVYRMSKALSEIERRKTESAGEKQAEAVAS